jgi:subtilisin family serine protease
MGPLELVQLTALMDRTSGRPDIRVGLIDGPVLITNPDLVSQNIREISGTRSTCAVPRSPACLHGTAVAGMLTARRGSVAAAICPGCTLLVRPIFHESHADNVGTPSATPEELASAIVELIAADARVLNVSAALTQPPARSGHELEEALNHAARRGAIVVAAAGNQGAVGSSVITRHPAVIPVASCDSRGRPLNESNLGRSIGRRGLSAPGTAITSLGGNGTAQTFSGTSAAAPFVTGAIALLWSEFSHASAAEVKLAIAQCGRRVRNVIVPPLLNAWAAHELLARAHN